jgi:hypothetical protein
MSADTLCRWRSCGWSARALSDILSAAFTSWTATVNHGSECERRSGYRPYSPALAQHLPEEGMRLHGAETAARSVQLKHRTVVYSSHRQRSNIGQNTTFWGVTDLKSSHCGTLYREILLPLLLF